jgi:hypothetical protein
MGQTLSEPVTNKETAICQDDNYKVNFIAMTHTSILAGVQKILRCYEFITLQCLSRLHPLTLKYLSR